jgi:TPR repeat protein
MRTSSLVVTVFLTSCAFAGPSGEKPEEFVMGNAAFVIPAAEIPSLESEALRGSAVAAFRLHSYFEMVVLDYREGFYWASIAAENGHPVGQYTLGFILADDSHASLIGRDDPKQRKRDRERARYWLRRAADNGNQRATELLHEIGE